MGVHATAAARPTSQSMVGCLSPPLPPPLQAVPRQSRPHAALRHRRRGIAAELVAAAGDGGIGKEGGAAGAAPAAFGRQRHLPAMLRPLSDPIANRKLLALSLAQCLSSIATLLHDTFLPLYMSEVLGMSNTTMGNLHGLLQLLARASGVIAGRLADIFGPARMVILGVGLTALVCKPMFALCGTVYTIAGAAACVTLITYAKMADRFVKGVRETPSKALVGDLAAESGDSAAAAFSVRQALSTFGMLVGSGAAAAVFKLTNRSYEATFALSVIPAALGLLLVATALGGDARATHHHAAHLASLDEGEDLSLLAKARMLAGALPSGYYQALAVMSVLYMARFDVAFITVHASAVMDTASLPLLTLCSMLPVVLLAAPMGLRAKTSVAARNTVLVCGIAMLGVGDLCYAFLPSVLGMVLGSTCVGLHMAMTQGVLFGMLASYIPSQALPGLGKISGTIWSFTDLLLGCALAYSNSLAGRLCDVTALRGMGNTGCFLGGAVISAASILVLIAFTSFGALGQEEAAAAAA